ncbi:hypothetical protein [Desulfocicer vacuolatum]|uniref:hypothetical protein n=1 Tax=Desulfocicer vacuolatum TaxID=2298 RepID=UPI00111BFE95|nr:hypothetical protein [Desulfocicer vacuolatum]
MSRRQDRQINDLECALGSQRIVSQALPPRSVLNFEKWDAIKTDMIRVLNERVPHVFLLPEFADRIASSLHKHGLSMTGKMIFQTGAMPEILGLNRYRTVINVSGKYPQFKRFIAELQNFPEILLIEDLTFSRSDDKNAGIKLSLTIDLFFKGNLDG